MPFALARGSDAFVPRHVRPPSTIAGMRTQANVRRGATRSWSGLPRTHPNGVTAVSVEGSLWRSEPASPVPRWSGGSQRSDFAAANARKRARSRAGLPSRQPAIRCSKALRNALERFRKPTGKRSRPKTSAASRVNVGPNESRCHRASSSPPGSHLQSAWECGCADTTVRSPSPSLASGVRCREDAS